MCACCFTACMPGETLQKLKKLRGTLTVDLLSVVVLIFANREQHVAVLCGTERG